MKVFRKVQEMQLRWRKCFTKGGSWGAGCLACSEMDVAHGCGTSKEGLYILAL